LRMMVSGNLNAHEIESIMDSEIETHYHDEHAENAAKANKPTDDYEHSFIVTGKPEASRVEQRGFLALAYHIVQPRSQLEFLFK